MKLLLDTHILLWAAGAPAKLPKKARKLLVDESNTLLFSAASLWEIVIKSAIGRDDFQVDARQLRSALVDNGYTEVPVTALHALGIADLPALHKDPFDRILLAQAMREELTLMTADAVLAGYPGPIMKV